MVIAGNIIIGVLVFIAGFVSGKEFFEYQNRKMAEFIVNMIKNNKGKIVNVEIEKEEEK